MLWIVLLGIVTGMRTLTGIAVVCWAVWLSLLPEHGWALWSGHLVSVIIFSVLAVGEYIGDTRPQTPSRKAPGPAAARIVFAALVGALVATAISEPIAGGMIAGIVGALIGTWGGYAVRHSAAQKVGRDLPVALMESAIALLLAVLSVWELHAGILIDMKRGAV